MNSSVLIIERPGSFRDALVSEIELSGTAPHVRDDAMDALATLQALSPKLVLVSEDPGPPGASSVCRLVRSKVEGATVLRLGDPSQRDALDEESPFLPRAIGPTAIARFLLARAENQNQELPLHRAWDAPLGSLELGPLLLAVSQRQLTGRLVLSSQAGERELAFARGYIVGSRSSMFAERLGQVAVKANLLTAAQLDQALDQARTSGKRLGEVLLDSRVFDGPKLYSALCAQFLEQVIGACNGGACHARFLLDESVIGATAAFRLHPVTAVMLAVRRTPKEDVGRVLDQLADRTLSAEHTPESVKRWLEVAGVSEPLAMLGSIASVRGLRDRLRERLAKSQDTDSDSVALALLRAGAMKLPGRASLVPTDLRSGVTTLSPPSVASAVVRCARAAFEAWPLTALAQAKTPLESALDAYLRGPSDPEAARADALRGPVSEASEVDPEILALAMRASGSSQRQPGAWLHLPPQATAREVRLACHALYSKFDAVQEKPEPPRSAGDRQSPGAVAQASVPDKPVERLRVAELRWQLSRALEALDASAVLPEPAAKPAAPAASAAAKLAPRMSATGGLPAVRPENAPATSHGGDPVLLSQVEPLVQQQRWAELRSLLASQEDGPANLPPAFALLYAIALKEGAGAEESTNAPREQAEALGIAAVSEMLSVPPHSATALIVAKRALRRRPLEWNQKASGRISVLFVILALICGAGVGLVLSPQLMQLMQTVLKQFSG
jgi:hypothetical protein